MSNTPPVLGDAAAGAAEDVDLLPGHGPAGGGDAGRERRASVGAVGLNPDGEQVGLGEDRAEGRDDVGEGGPHGQHGGHQLRLAASPTPGMSWSR